MLTVKLKELGIERRRNRFIIGIMLFNNSLISGPSLGDEDRLT